MRGSFQYLQFFLFFINDEAIMVMIIW